MGCWESIGDEWVRLLDWFGDEVVRWRARNRTKSKMRITRSRIKMSIEKIMMIERPRPDEAMGTRREGRTSDNRYSKIFSTCTLILIVYTYVDLDWWRIVVDYDKWDSNGRALSLSEHTLVTGICVDGKQWFRGCICNDDIRSPRKRTVGEED